MTTESSLVIGTKARYFVPAAAHWVKIQTVSLMFGAVGWEASSMRLITAALVGLCFLIALTTRLAAGNPPEPHPSLQDKLVGSWKLVSAKYGGKEYTYPEGTTMVVHLTRNQFM